MYGLETEQFIELKCFQGTFMLQFRTPFGKKGNPS